MVRLYVDGCSMTNGFTLPREYSLGRLLNASTDLSRPGKSNIGICIDLFENIHEYDVFVIGLTYYNRYTFFDNDRPIDIHPSLKEVRLSSAYMDSDLYPPFFKMLWLMTNETKLFHFNKFLAQSVINLLEQENKKFFVFSWEDYSINKIIPMQSTFSQEYHISKFDKHLNEKGMTLLSQIVKKNLSD